MMRPAAGAIAGTGATGASAAEERRCCAEAASSMRCPGGTAMAAPGAHEQRVSPKLTMSACAMPGITPKHQSPMLMTVSHGSPVFIATASGGTKIEAIK